MVTAMMMSIENSKEQNNFRLHTTNHEGGDSRAEKHSS